MKPPLRVLIGTPCGGGDVTTNFLASYMATMTALEIPRNIIIRDLQRLESGINSNSLPPDYRTQAIQQYSELSAKPLYEVALYTLAMESLLGRGRNHIAQRAMADSWDKLIFIDADSEWTPEQFIKIIQSPYPITAGTVPLKTYPIVLNYLPFKADQEKYCPDGLKTPESMWRMSYDKGRYVRVARVGTGFLAIDVKKVLCKLAETTKQYMYPNPATGYNETHYAFFNEGPQGDDYYSEDWAFIDNAQKAGFDCVIDTDVTIGHRGSHVFRAPQKPTKEQFDLNQRQQLEAQFQHYQQLKAMYSPEGP